MRVRSIVSRRCAPVRAAILAALVSLHAAALAGPTVTLTEVASAAALPGSPLFVTHAGDGSGRIFIVQQRGQISILSGGTVNPTLFLDASTTGLGLVSASGSERGLLGLAFHPDYASNGRFFISYTRASDGASMITRFNVSGGNPNLADTASLFHVLGPVAQPEANHNGGCIQFGPDDMLYLGLGDGGGAGDVHGSIGNGQDTTNLLGSLLRLDVDAAPDLGLNYHIPTDNPFFVTGPDPATRKEIYAYGLRNPWRFSFDRGTGRLFLADVGQGLVEEIDLITAAGNYGWRRMEGNQCFNPASGCQTGSLLLPIATYPSTGTECSVTGGYVYRGTDYPPMQGFYLYGDYCSGKIWTLEETSPGVFAIDLALDSTLNITSFGEDEQGELYVCNDGQNVLKIVGPVPVDLSGFALE